MKFDILPVFVNLNSFYFPYLAGMISFTMDKHSLKLVTLLGLVKSIDFYS